MGKKIVILDYGSGNVKSVFNLCSYLNDNVVISNEVKDIKNSSHIILPGVGSYNVAMKKIHKNLPVDNILEQLHNAKKPFLGICVGMQVLSDYGFEFEKSKGLGLINGSVKLLKTNTLPLPNIGWNEIKIEKKSPLFKNIDDKRLLLFCS
jgi:glutamine amidotransferase